MRTTRITKTPELIDLWGEPSNSGQVGQVGTAAWHVPIQWDETRVDTVFTTVNGGVRVTGLNQASPASAGG